MGRKYLDLSDPKKAGQAMKVLLALTLLLCACSKKGGLKIAATPIPHAEILEHVKPALHEKGIDLQIIVVGDYNTPNRALADSEIDVNFFQHLPFLESQVKEFHYKIENFGKIEIEPMGIYSKKIRSLNDLKDGAQIAIPNDPTNEGRALILLNAQGIIELQNPNDFTATPLNIQKNPKHLKFIEVDAAMLPRTLDDVDAALINTNYALQAGLTPEKDALALESKDSPYANILAIRIGDENRPDLIHLKESLTSEEMRKFILDTYKGAVLPAF